MFIIDLVQALRDVLNAYVPFEDGKQEDLTSLIGEQEMSKPNSISTIDNDLREGVEHSLEHDHLQIGSVKVPFLVSRGRVFFDQLAAFTVLGQLRLPLMNDWELCDKILLEQGLSQKDAFFRQTRTSGMLSVNSSGGDSSTNGGLNERKRPPSHITHQSHITFKAIRVLTEHGLVTDASRKKSLVALFGHLQNEIDRVFQCRKNIIEKIQECMNVSHSSYASSFTQGMCSNSFISVKRPKFILLYFTV